MRGGAVNATPRPLYPLEKPCIAGWVGPWASLDGYRKSRPLPAGIRSPDRPARSESLYRLSYRGPQLNSVTIKVIVVVIIYHSV